MKENDFSGIWCKIWIHWDAISRRMYRFDCLIKDRDDCLTNNPLLDAQYNCWEDASNYSGIESFYKCGKSRLRCGESLQERWESHIIYIDLDSKNSYLLDLLDQTWYAVGGPKCVRHYPDTVVLRSDAFRGVRRYYQCDWCIFRRLTLRQERWFPSWAYILGNLILYTF